MQYNAELRYFSGNRTDGVVIESRRLSAVDIAAGLALESLDAKGKHKI